MSIEVNIEIRRSSTEVVEGFRRLLEEYYSIAPGISDVMNRLNAMSSNIKPLWELRSECRQKKLPTRCLKT